MAADETGPIPPRPTEPRRDGAAGRPVARALADIAGMIRFFSRIPVPRLSGLDDPAALPDFARAVRLLPLAGLVVGLPAALVLVLLGATGLPPLAVAGFALAAGLATTGALHEDGLADLADGFGGGASRDRKLEIMKDSRIGAYGAAAMTLALMIRAGLLTGLIAGRGPLGAALALLAAAALSRPLAVSLMAALPPARARGAAHAAGMVPRATAAIAVAFGIALAVPLVALHGPVAAALAGIVLAALAVALLGRVSHRQIGGQTGDVIGAAQQIAEIAFLAALAT
ncbi:adenosylcobinamide-GDP ribazoletransferase [Prosthecodimorpha staleyi]|uniref:Adenosylcobinamide-GDP ribazoletransferase n=1 Tax=Prosthecodimorpha staleyi TaxID=2840188 RepID=A0A947DAX1_9HYPH|nr:adenosylcobinamide-GDP ribazoletransferase [Prosthecodimorpha staleyi]MBT9290534.1 adenosylcobinamide-GDP ribazoletransferase [Prosthecodimorpha staleyi]